MTVFSNTRSVRRAALMGSAALLAAPLALGGSAVAQTAPASAPAGVEEVVITGSRVARAGFTTPTPTTVVSPILLNTNVNTTLAGVLNSLPAFKADYSPAASGSRSFDSPGASFADLRSLGSPRTLTLVDGRRIVPSSPSAQTDLNIIPSILTDRVEVVTGGASAAYGSDAVAGVVNILLKHNLQGVIGDVSYGESQQHDNIDKHIGLAAGTAFMGGRGHLTVGGEYDKNEGAKTAYSRDWGRKEYGLLPNPGPGPSNLIVSGYRPSNMAPGGLVASGPLKGLEFLPGGQTRQFQYGAIVGPSFMSGGANYGQQFSNAQLSVPLDRQNILGRVDFDLNDKVSVFAEAAWAKSQTNALGAQIRDSTPITVQKTNPYLPASVVALMTAAGVTTIPVGRNNFDLGYTRTDVSAEVQRYVVGGKGEFGEGWSWDAYAQYGRTDYSGKVLGGRLNARFALAADAAVNPANGQIVCRSTLTDPTNGCVPVNIFGSGSISDAGKAYFLANQDYELQYEQTLQAANLRGAPFSTWAGKVSMAAGLEHRKEQVGSTTDPLAAANLFNAGNQKPINGSLEVTEGYLEGVFPLLSQQALAKRLELDAAVRQTHYSTSGGATTWKIGLNWEVNDQFRLRATRSHDIRAANIAELYTIGSSSSLFIVNPRTQVSTIVPNVTIGNPNLEPEEADTTTFGVVLKPSFAPNLDISVDRYDIDLKKAIGGLTGQQIVNFCFAGQTSLCQFISTNSAGTFTQITLARINIASIHTAGYDFEVRYRTPLGALNVPGDLTLQLYGTYVDKMVVNDGTGIVDYAGEVGSPARGAYGLPRWRSSLLATYETGPLQVTGTVRYVGGGNYSNVFTSAQINNNDVKSATYADLAAQYDLVRGDARNVTLYAIVQNLFDKDPPVVPTLTSSTNPVIYDVIGRTYRAGVRFRF